MLFCSFCFWAFVPYSIWFLLFYLQWCAFVLATSFGYLIGSAKVLNVQTSNYFTHASLVASSLPYVQIDCLSVAHMHSHKDVSIFNFFTLTELFIVL